MWIINIISIIAGGSAGWLYYKLVGCASGSCPVTSNPFTSILVGSVFGLLLIPDIIKSFKKKKSTETDTSSKK